MNTICITLPPLREITRAGAADWGPGLRRAAGTIAAVVAVAYTAGLCTGLLVRQLLAWAEYHHLTGLTRLGLPGGNSSAWLTSLGTTPPPRPVLALPPAPAVPVTTPRREACRQLKKQGLSLARIAQALGISRTTVRRELAA